MIPLAFSRVYRSYRNSQRDLFTADDGDEIGFDIDSIQKMVLVFQGLNLKKMEPTALSYAFQVFRNANLKIGDGQYFTPWKVIEAGVKLMGVTARDKVSDLRAGLVNPNSTNVVSRELARRFWKGESSGLRPYDIITPSRASKNIGEPVMLLPG